MVALNAVFSVGQRPAFDRDVCMLRWRVAYLSPALAVLLSLLLLETAAAQIFSGRRQSRLIGQPGDGQNWFAIMGHVEKPTTYELPTASPSLVDFVRFAGGLKNSATNRIRIIRNGRDGNQSWFSPNSTVRLMPGDLVICDGRVSNGTIFRGGNTRTPQDGPIQIGLVGVLDYPIVMRAPAESATVQWITQQLGQPLELADSVRVLTPVRRGQVRPDTALADNTVLVFDQQMIDRRLLPKLPVPVNGKRQTEQPPGDARPESARARTTNDPRSARPEQQFNPLPGHAPMPGVASTRDVADEPEPAGRGIDEEVVKDILTHPDSVELEPHRTDQPGRSRVSDTGSARVDSPVPTRRPAPAASGPLPDEPIDPHELFAPKPPVPPVESPEAQRPFESVDERDSAANTEQEFPGGPVPEHPSRIEGAVIGSNPNRPTTSNADAPQPLPSPTVSQPERDGSRADRPDSGDVQTSPASADKAPTVGSQRNNPNPQIAPSRNAQSGLVPIDAANQTQTPFMSELSTDAGPLPDSVADSAVASDIGQDHRDTGQPLQSADEAGTRVIPGEPKESRWPLILAGLIGGVGGVYAIVMLFVMGVRPAPSRPTPEPQSDRYWLDRLISNDLPIEEQKASAFDQQQLFGRPTPASILRVDCGHQEIPKPHFLSRGDQSGVAGRKPTPPEQPEPELTDPEHREDSRTVKPTRRPPAPGRNVPPIPVRPAAELEPAAQAVATDATDSPPVEASRSETKAKRFVRIDSGHETPGSAVGSTKAPKIARRKVVAVKPSPTVTEGFDVLDRALSAVPREQS